MEAVDQIAWLARRAGWGLAPGELDRLADRGTDALLDELVDPAGAGLVASTPPFAGFVSAGPDQRQEDGLAVLGLWLDHLMTTTRPLEDAAAWFWHDHFAVSVRVVQHVPAMIDHIELLRTGGMGSFPDLLRAVTTDAAMLVFLDGATSTGAAPNENFGRELLELYTVGIENYTEDDVRAAAAALTGWVVRRRLDWSVQFVPGRHDDTPRTLLGASGIHDVETVIEAAVAHPGLAPFIAAKFARRMLGAGADGVVTERAADRFTTGGLVFSELARSVLESGLDGSTGPIVLEPVPWLVQATRATGARLENRMRSGLLRMMGQVPGAPPNVGGFPPAPAWLASSATAARFTAANMIAALTPAEAPALDAARRRDWGELAHLLLRPAGFSATTVAALGDLSDRTNPRPGEAHLALALASPDLLVA